MNNNFIAVYWLITRLELSHPLFWTLLKRFLDPPEENIEIREQLFTVFN